MPDDKPRSKPPLRSGLYTTIIPVHGDTPFLDRALESIHNQTAPSGPILLVADPPATILRHHVHNLISKEDYRVTLLEAPEPGLIAAINHGIKQVDTPFVSFLDSDDLWAAHKQDGQLRLLLADDSLDAVTSLGAQFQGQETPDRLSTPHPCATFTATTFRRAVFERFGLLDPHSTHYTWLYRWWIHARMNGLREAILPELSLYRRVHPGSSWVVGYERGHRELLDELRRISRVKLERTTQGLTR
jgi:glycosyltransferase involved in cell wall biosynthesis